MSPRSASGSTVKRLWVRPAAAASEAGDRRTTARPGKIRPMLLLWALGVPIPIVLIIFLIRGCM